MWSIHQAHGFRGDEINFAGTLSPYAIVNLRTSYQLGPNIQVYGLLENVTNTRSRSFGTFFDTNDISFLAFNNPRMVSLGPPLGNLWRREDHLLTPRHGGRGPP